MSSFNLAILSPPIAPVLIIGEPKPNQIGSLSETYATVKLAKENDIVPVVSHK